MGLVDLHLLSSGQPVHLLAVLLLLLMQLVVMKRDVVVDVVAHEFYMSYVER